MSLDDEFRRLAKAGSLSHLSITPKHEGTKFIGFCASYTSSLGSGHGIAVHKDPVEAITAAIKNSPKTKPAPQKRKKGEEPWL